MKRFLIIGGGAAGMLASVYAARNGMEVHLFEQNEKLGKKLFITGKGRCNFTNGCATEELFESFITNPRFLYSAVYGYTNYDVIDFFETAGVKTKMERGGRMFPLSDHSSDIIRALEQQMKKAGVKIHLGSRVKRLLVEKEEDGNARITGIQLDNGEKIRGEQVLVATGGNSYPSTGSTGDGYRMAKESGHTVTDLQPSLVPMVTAEEYIPRLQGLSLKNVTLSLYDGKKCVYEDFGEMMFTHFGITGPLVLSASAKVGKLLKKKYLTARIDLKPALTAEQLDARLLREFEEGKNKQFKNVAGSLFPAKLLPVMLDLGGIAPGKKVHEITREERAGFIEKTKAFPFTVTGLRGFQEAIITKGGVQVKEVDPKTMESKKTKGLYFAGEVLDLDALTGGYNLQIAWSTAHAAAMAAAEAERGKHMSYAIAIDGPSGAGKSTIAKRVAKELSFIYVDTGAMYRAMALYVLEQNIDPQDQAKVAAVCPDIDVTILYEDGVQQVLLNGKNVSAEIRQEIVGNTASKISVIKEVREKLVALQRQLAAKENVVMDGRDIGTQVLPNATVKIYLTASAKERAKRRYLELQEKGMPGELDQIEADIIERDNRDMNREISPLRQAEDAVLVDASFMGIEEVTAAVIAEFEKKKQA